MRLQLPRLLGMELRGRPLAPLLRRLRGRLHGRLLGQHMLKRPKLCSRRSSFVYRWALAWRGRCLHSLRSPGRLLHESDRAGGRQPVGRRLEPLLRLLRLPRLLQRRRLLPRLLLLLLLLPRRIAAWLTIQMSNRAAS